MHSTSFIINKDNFVSTRRSWISVAKVNLYSAKITDNPQILTQLVIAQKFQSLFPVFQTK